RQRPAQDRPQGAPGGGGARGTRWTRLGEARKNLSTRMFKRPSRENPAQPALTTPTRRSKGQPRRPTNLRSIRGAGACLKEPNPSFAPPDESRKPIYGYCGLLKPQKE